MSNDLDIVAIVDFLPHPATGEALEPTPANAALVLDAVRDGISSLSYVRRLAVDVLRAESERQGTKTLHVGDRTVTLSGGPRDDYDTDALQANLEAAGCPPERVKDALGKPTYKPRRNVLKQLAAANPAYAAAIANAVVRVDAPVQARVT